MQQKHQERLYIFLTFFFLFNLVYTSHIAFSKANGKSSKSENQNNSSNKSENKLTENVSYLEVIAKKGDGIANLLKRFNLEQDKLQMNLFKELNIKSLGKANQVYADQKYKLPILVYKKGTKKKLSKANDFELRDLELFNRKLEAKELKGNFKEIWVPATWLSTENLNLALSKTEAIEKEAKTEKPIKKKQIEEKQLISSKLDLASETKKSKHKLHQYRTVDSVKIGYNSNKKLSAAEENEINDSLLLNIANKFNKVKTKKSKKQEETIEEKVEELKQEAIEEKVSDNKNTNFNEKSLVKLFGKAQVKKQDSKLKNYAFYLDAGHGGPDPGAVGNREGKELHEDEYAYDITLRLAKKLYESGATVFMIVQDEADGIRDDKYLTNSFDEVYYGGIKIDRNQKTRLNKRAEIINAIHSKNKKIKNHYAITIHIDSRDQGKRVDIFCYHKEGKTEGKKLAETMVCKIEEKYDKAQPGRGYRGSVTSRSLLMLRKNIPTSVYFELGNIQNTKDQIRFIDNNNRQAISNWLYEGILDFDKSKGKN